LVVFLVQASRELPVSTVDGMNRRCIDLIKVTCLASSN